MPSEQELESLIVRLKGDGSGYKRMLEEAHSQTNLADGHFQLATQRIQAMGLSFRGYGAQAAAMVIPLVGGAGLIAEAYKGIGLAAQAEQDEVAFGVMLHSMERGRDMVAQIQKFAAETPLGTAEINVATKSLLQFGVAGADIIPTLRMIGDIGGGNADKLQRMAIVFGQIKSVGHLMGQDKMQLIQMGFNPLAEIARTSGKSVEELQAMEEKGLVTFQMVKDAFKSATSAGGDYFNQMELQSHTTTGLFSTMKDDIDAMLRNVGKALVENLNLKEFMADVSSVAQYWTEKFQQISPATLKAAASILVVVTAVTSLTIAVGILGTAFSVLFGGIGLVGGEVLTLVAIATGFGSAWVVSVGGINEAVHRVVASVREWVNTHQDLMVRIGLGAAVVFALVSAFKIASGAVAVLHALYVALHIQQLIGLGLWLAWKVVVLVATGVWMLFNAQVALYNVLIGGAAAGSVVYSAGLLVMKAAIWLVNAALTVMDVLLAPVTLLALVGTAGLLVEAFVAADIVVRGLAGGVGALFDLLGNAGNFAAPVAHIGSLLGEWVENVKLFVHALGVDSSQAMNILATSGELAWSQIRDASTPMWEYLKAAGSAAWDYIARMAIFKAGEAADQWNLTLKSAYHLDWDDDDMKRYRKAIEDAYRERREAAKQVADAEMALANRNFKVAESDRTKDLKAKLAGQKDVLKALEDAQANLKAPGRSFFFGFLADQFDRLKSDSQTAAAVVKGSMQTIQDATLVGSAESGRRIADYLDRLHGDPTKAPGYKPPSENERGPMPRPVSVVASAPGIDMAVTVLTQIRELLKRQEKKAVGMDLVMLPANL